MGTMKSKEEMKKALAELVSSYNQQVRVRAYATKFNGGGNSQEGVSEETIRSWLNDFLLIFGWDVKNTSQVLQEYVLKGNEKRRLEEIQSSHIRPDYILMNGANIKTFLDAKSLAVDISSDASVAFQIRSYGWSAKVPCAFVSNFEQFAVYDTRKMPSPNQPANYGMTIINCDEYLEKFDYLYEHLCFELVCKNHLQDLYHFPLVEGKAFVDEEFANVLAEYRIKIALELLKNNPNIIKNSSMLNYYTQIIIDRIIFIRVCESKGIEEQEKLRKYTLDKDGFWKNFKESCYVEFYEHYDGAMFTKDALFQQLSVSDKVLKEFIEHLYYPYPYRFDVIPVKVIANIYEEFLGISLEIKNGGVEAVTKDEYVKTNGAVCTPEHIVDMVCKQTLDLSGIKTVEELFSVRVLEPCCGSGVFLVSCYEMLADRLLEILNTDKSEVEKHKNLSVLVEGRRLLTIEGRRAVVKNCLYSIDCDESAVEVTKMSLALKIVDGNNPLAWNKIGVYGKQILKDVSENIRLGNTLVEDTRKFSGSLIEEIKPIDIRNEFKKIFDNQGGFSYIVGNPPYVETKYYKAAQPAMHAYLREKFSSFEGKVDLSVLFIERCLYLLAPKGKLGMIVQRRWFKTNYGKTARRVISQGGFLNKLIDFKATDIFKGRITYVSIMVLSRENNNAINYYYDMDDTDTIKTSFENSDRYGNFEGCEFVPVKSCAGDEVWAFESYKIQSLKEKLSSKFGTINDYEGLAVKDGIQALWKKVYHITNATLKDGIVTGVNGFNDKVKVEEDVVRAVIYNKVFYPFKDVQPDAYCIFPYYGASTDPILYEDIKANYPLLYRYLESNKEKIQKEVNCREGNMWHTFTREHNQSLYNVNKIIIPMTAKDTIATYIENRGLYMDNSNVWFIYSTKASKEEMKALTCVINSTVFSVLGKAGANPQSGDYYKFNKQFITPIPVPIKKLSGNTPDVKALADMYDEISDLQNRYISAGTNGKEVLERVLKECWVKMDSLCNELYELNSMECELVMGEGRTVSRIALLNGTE